MRNSSRASVAILVMVALLLSTCAHVSPTVVSGQSLKLLADEFVAVGKFMNEGLKKGTVTPAQYAKWGVFAKKFKVIWPLALDLWQATKDLEDVAANERISSLIAGLADELHAFMADFPAAWQEFQPPAHPDGGS